ncbi:hypothetical protein MNBD_GAMMA18-1535 [hydrothermal vent metagenome]|uniref:EF-hand domain-containing protein n=1 Tax=hydrothermal vent metagenome TaxID=652676 RepID=A0A3B0ZNR9_9ZZZZ
MKNKWILIACAGTLFSSIALAEDMGGEQPTFANLDTDRNGTLSVEEAAANQQLAQEWRNLDTNSDGLLEEAEFSRFKMMEESE